MLIYVGASLDRTPGPRYAQSLPFAELSFRAPLPRPGTLARWRAEIGADLRVALVLPKDCVVAKEGPLRVDALGPRFQWLRAAADALDAAVLVVPTGTEITPGHRDRERLATYFEALRKAVGRPIVWAPAGLWEAEVAAPAAAGFGVALAFDPLEDDVPEGPLLYARLRTLGARSRISTGMLAEAADVLFTSGAEAVYVAIASGTATRDARTLQSLIAGAVAASEEDADEDEDTDADDEDEDEDEDEDSDEDLDEDDEDEDEDEDDTDEDDEGEDDEDGEDDDLDEDDEDDEDDDA